MDIELIATTAPTRSSYRPTCAEFREQVRAEVLVQIVTDSMETSTDDEIFPLVIEDYDPDDNTEVEKATMVDERETEIREVIRQQVRKQCRDELRVQIDRRSATDNHEIKDDIAGSVERSGGDRDPALLNATRTSGPWALTG